MTTLYEALGVPKNATQADIKRAYRRKSKSAHPDREGGSHAAMTAINRAYALLSDESKRAHYDQTGEEQVTPIEQMAKANLVALLGELLEKYTADGEFNLVKQMREVIKSKMTEVEVMITTQRRKFAKIERILKKNLKPGKNANAVLTQMIEHQLQQTKGKVAELEKHKEVGACMLKMLEEYGWEAEIEESRGKFTWGHEMFADLRGVGS